MSGREDSSRTMRIDLIPEIPDKERLSGDRVVIKAAEPRPVDADTFMNGDAAHGPFRDLLQSIYDAALIVDVEGRIQDFNQRALEFFLYPASELRAQTIFDVISGADESLIGSLREHLVSEKYALIQAYCLRKNATVFPSEIAVSQLDAGNGTGLCFFVRDVTIRRQTEEMLWTEHNAIQNCGSGIAVAELNAKLEYANQAVAHMWGYEDGEALIGTDVRSLMSDSVSADAMIAAVLAAERGWIGQMNARRRDGSEFSVQVSAACNRLAEGELVGIVLSFVDVSDRIRAEEAVRDAEQQRVMLESLGAACHHLGQPATVLLGNLELLHDQLQAEKADNGDLVSLADASLAAMRQMGQLLHRLNSVNEYKTTTYTSTSELLKQESRILDI